MIELKISKKQPINVSYDSLTNIAYLIPKRDNISLAPPFINVTAMYIPIIINTALPIHPGIV